MKGGVLTVHCQEGANEAKHKREVSLVDEVLVEKVHSGGGTDMNLHIPAASGTRKVLSGPLVFALPDVHSP